jgi:hypothetical protein
MQKIATRVFIISSISFGVFGILLVLIPQGPFDNTNIFFTVTQKLFMISVFVVLSSFAITVASRFLINKR